MKREEKRRIKLAKLKAKYQELVLCDKETKYIRWGERQVLAGKIAAIEARLRIARDDKDEDEEFKAALADMMAQSNETREVKRMDNDKLRGTNETIEEVELPFVQAINRKLDALRGAVTMLVKASHTLLDEDARVIMEDLDEVWDES